jgi:flagellar hook-basal body complex protein FliE
MSQFSIEFGSRMSTGGSIDSSSLREQRENIAPAGESGASGKATTFGDFLQNLVQETNQAAVTADQKLQDVAAGRNKDLHGAVLAMEKADVQFRLLSQVRNKVIEAYREIMRMQV